MIAGLGDRLMRAHKIGKKGQITIEQEILDIEEGKSAIRGMLFASIFSIPIWFLIVGIVIWLF
jgi:hypothetical protein